MFVVYITPSLGLHGSNMFRMISNACLESAWFLAAQVGAIHDFATGQGSMQLLALNSLWHMESTGQDLQSSSDFDALREVSNSPLDELTERS